MIPGLSLAAVAQAALACLDLVDLFAKVSGEGLSLTPRLLSWIFFFLETEWLLSTPLDTVNLPAHYVVHRTIIALISPSLLALA